MNKPDPTLPTIAEQEPRSNWELDNSRAWMDALVEIGRRPWGKS
jgi:hypothetical protein